MSQSATRSTAFLQEMGIGVQWKLRNGDPVEPEADAFVTAVQALADGFARGRRACVRCAGCRAAGRRVCRAAYRCVG